jgi:hypothetical protein
VEKIGEHANVLVNFNYVHTISNDVSVNSLVSIVL